MIPNIWKIKHVPNHQPESDISDIRPSVEMMSFPTSVDQLEQNQDVPTTGGSHKRAPKVGPKL
jgi:hypothetical protein